MASKIPSKGKSLKGLNANFDKKNTKGKTGKGTPLKTSTVTEADLENAMKGIRKR